ncbi:hypothetical protein GCM10027416_08710 [Okibacterium endophyticum]
MTPPIGREASFADASDAQLIEWSRAGDKAAFGELWRRHYNAGRTVARSFTSSLDPDDLVQESFAKIFQAVQKGGGPTGSFRAYLFTTIRNTAAAWGRARHETSIDTLESFEDPNTNEDASLEALDHGLTAQAFKSLPSRWQEVLWYTEIEQMTPQQTAPLLGMKPNSVAALAYRAREGLRHAWIQAHLKAAPESSDCQWTIERLPGYARGNLGERDTRKLEEHLDSCSRCTIVAAEAKDVSSRIALVLLPLTAGVAGTAAYLAWLQQGGQHAAATMAMPASVTGGAAGAVFVHGSAGAADAAGSSMAGSPAGGVTGSLAGTPTATAGGGTASSIPAAASGSTGGGTATGSVVGSGARSSRAMTGASATTVVVGAVAATLVAAGVAAAVVFGPTLFAPTSPPLADTSQAPTADPDSHAGTDADTERDTESEAESPPIAPPLTPPDGEDRTVPPQRTPSPPASAPLVPTIGQPESPPPTEPTTPPIDPGTGGEDPDPDPDDPDDPAPPVVSVDDGGGMFVPILSGTAVPGSTITITEVASAAPLFLAQADPAIDPADPAVEPDVPLATTTTNNDGTWSVELDSGLSPGDYTVSVRQTTTNGTSAESRISFSHSFVELAIVDPIDDDNRVTANRTKQYFEVEVRSKPGSTVRLVINDIPLETLQVSDSNGVSVHRVNGPFPAPSSSYSIVAQYVAPHPSGTGLRLGFMSAPAIVTFV